MFSNCGSEVTFQWRDFLKRLKHSSVGEIKPSYYPEMNYLRGFAILAVIITHVSAHFTDLSEVNALSTTCMVLDSLSSYAVPAFLFISGFVLINKYRKPLDINKYYIKRFKSIVPQYIIFSIIYTMYNEQPIVIFFHNLLTGGSFYHMWFFVLIIELYIFYPLILDIYNYSKSKNMNTSLLITTAIMGIIYNMYFTSYQLVPQLFGWVFYFILGFVVRDNYELTKLENFFKKYALVVCVVIAIGTLFSVVSIEFTYFPSYKSIFETEYAKLGFLSATINLVYNTVLFMLFLNISAMLSSQKKYPIIDKIGSFSFAIYLIHPLVLEQLIKIWFIQFHSNTDNWLFYPYAYITTIIISIILVKIVKLFSFSDYIIGKTSDQSAL